MVAPNPLAARRRTNSSSFSSAVPSSWDESVVNGAIANRFAISRPLLNLNGDQTTIDQTSDILKLGGWNRYSLAATRLWGRLTIIAIATFPGYCESAAQASRTR